MTQSFDGDEIGAAIQKARTGTPPAPAGTLPKRLMDRAGEAYVAGDFALQGLLIAAYDALGGPVEGKSGDATVTDAPTVESDTVWVAARLRFLVDHPATEDVERTARGIVRDLLRANKSWLSAGQRLSSDDSQPFACPVCRGTGCVSRPSHIPGDVPTWSSSSVETYICNACKGQGIVWRSPSTEGATNG